MKTINVFGRSKMVIIGSILVFILPILLSGSSLWTRVYSYVMIYGIMSSAMNLMNGFAGQMSLAVGAVAGFGAYTSANITMKLGLPFWIALPVAALVATVVGVGMSFPGIRVRGFFFAIITLIMQNILVQVFLDWYDFTRGDVGLAGIPYPDILGFKITGIYYAYLTTAFLAATVYLIHRVVNSKVGLHLKAIRGDDILASSLGHNVLKYKLLVYVISSFLVGIAGSLLAHTSIVISPRMFTIALSFQILTQNRVGGQGTILGPLLGTALLVSLPYGVRQIYEVRDIIYGCLLIMSGLVLPQGLYGVLKSPRIKGIFKS